MLETRVESLCGEELRRYRDELRAELGAQQREQQELRRQQAAWSKDLQELQEDLQVVCDGLRRAGVLTPKDLWDSRKARRGAELLKAAFQMTDIAAAVGHFAGPVAAGSLGASSPSHGAGIRDALPSILSRCWAPDLYVCGGQAYGTRSVPAERFDTDTQRWLPLPPMPTARSWCAAVTCAGKLYVLGGRSACGSDLSTVECYNPAVCRWELLAAMPSSREACAATSSGGFLFAFGGSRSGKVLCDAEAYDLLLGTWQVLPPMPTPRSWCAAVAARGLIYVVGGDDGGQNLATLECYNPATRFWERLPAMSTGGREACAAVSAGGFLYVFGGSRGGEDLATAERFDPSSKRWVHLLSMPVARAYCTAVAVDLAVLNAADATEGSPSVRSQRRPLLYVLGGRSSRAATAERYDPVTGLWEVVSALTIGSSQYRASSYS